MPELRRETLCPAPRQRPLTWAPPALVDPLVITIGPGSHSIGLADGQDCLLKMPATYDDFAGIGPSNAMVQIRGGRNVVLIGGHVHIGERPATTVTAPAGPADTTITVASTAGFPSAGQLRIDGEYLVYTGTTPTSFTGCTRDAGFFFTGPYSSTTHAPGAAVYIDDSFRTGFTFLGQTGTTHLEGLLIDGPQLADGLRILGAPGSIYQLQNSRIGPVGGYDEIYASDTHPDCVQIITGPAQLRMDRVSLLTRSGRGIINQGSDTSQPLVSADLRDVELIDAGRASQLIRNTDRSTTWSMANVWGYPRSPGASISDDAALAARVQVAPIGNEPAGFCPAGVPGANYVSPGYLS